MRHRRLAVILLVVTCALTVQAQSGRRQVKPEPAAPVPSPTPEPTPIPKAPHKDPELLFFLGADRDTFASFSYSYYDAVLRGCADRLRSGSSAGVDVTDRGFNRADAIKKAKAESKSYVVLLSLKLDTMARSYDDLVLEYNVFAPGTAKVVTSGRSYQRATRAGPVVVGPNTRGSNNTIYREELLRQAGEDAGNRILKAMNLDVDIPH